MLATQQTQAVQIIALSQQLLSLYVQVNLNG